MHSIPPHRFYYLHNFEQALEWLAARYGDVLDECEKQFISQFLELEKASRALLVRLVMRKGPWFLTRKVVYEEIPDVLAAGQSLESHGWISSCESISLDVLFDLHTKQELLEMPLCQGLSASLKKKELLAHVKATCVDNLNKPYSGWCEHSSEIVWHVKVASLCERLRLMFFGNLHQQWSEFVLADLGIFKYEQVPLSAESRAFTCKQDVDDYLQLHQLRETLDQLGPSEDLIAQATAVQTANPWLLTRKAKLLMRIGQSFERSHDWTQAYSAYACSNYPGARYRKLRTLERLGDFAQALVLAHDCLQSPESEEESQRLQRMLPRLKRAVGQTVTVRRSALKPEIASLRLDVELVASEVPCSVEHCLRDHWNTAATPVFYVENALINSLFGLLCWDALFAPLPGAFFHPFQSGPADLRSPDFVSRRMQLFETCLQQLETGAYRETVLRNFADKHGMQAPFVFWGALQPELLQLALECIPAQHLRLFFARLLQDLGSNRTGLPDLIRFWPAEKRYMLVEVKAPGDKLQDNQVRWLEYCCAHEIPVQVCHVQWRQATSPVQTVCSEAL